MDRHNLAVMPQQPNEKYFTERFQNSYLETILGVILTLPGQCTLSVALKSHSEEIKGYCKMRIYVLTTGFLSHSS